ncbi:MAG TPA: glycosyltransferase family 4 protein [Candidatus Binatia bacterium]|nr:glycosyltransferase family 4 protein [Candidatus Binatia bacterium]
MSIAQVAPLYESVPPKSYGGTERVVSYLTEELVAQGHDVTLFASGDSVTNARLVASSPDALRSAQYVSDPLAYHFVQLEQVFAQSESFDVIHFHNDYLHYPLSRRHNTPHLTTLHGRLDMPELAQLYEIFADVPIVSISNAQRKPLSWANWQRTVYHGLPTDLYTARQEQGSYLAFLGRICPEKRLDRAIQIAQQFGMTLKVAAKVDAADRHYYGEVIEPLLDEISVEFIGEVNEDGKQEFLSNAYALLLPIDWPEPFGLVIIEAMACGTPVIAYPHGSIPELIENGVTGFIVENIDQAAQALQTVPNVDRRLCRQRFEERFSAARMAQDYVELYQRLIHASDVVPGAGTESVRRAIHRPNVLNAAVRNGRA